MWGGHLAQPPSVDDYDFTQGDGARARYLRDYGAMPECVHKPELDEKFNPANSDVLKFLMERSGKDSMEWLQAEFHRICRWGTRMDQPNAVFVYNPEKRTWHGRLTYTAEAKPIEAAKIEAEKAEAARILNEKMESEIEAAIKPEELEEQNIKAEKIEAAKIEAARIDQLSAHCRLMPYLKASDTGAINDVIDWIKNYVTRADPKKLLAAAEKNRHVVVDSERGRWGRRNTYIGADYVPPPPQPLETVVPTATKVINPQKEKPTSEPPRHTVKWTVTEQDFPWLESNDWGNCVR
jgi:hypothetical protein